MLSVVVNRDPLKQIVDSLFLANEALVNISEEGLGTRVVHETNVAKAQIDVESGAFDSYEATARTMGVDIETLSNVVNQANSGDRIELELVEDGTTLLVDDAGQEYYITLIDPNHISPPGDLPSADPSVQTTINAKEFRDAIEAADTFSKRMTIKTHPNGGLVMEGKGDDNRTRKHIEEGELVDFEGGEANSTFSLEFLKGIRSALDGSETVRLGIGEDRPLHVEFEYIRGFGKAEYFIAPYIENN